MLDIYQAVFMFDVSACFLLIFFHFFFFYGVILISSFDAFCYYFAITFCWPAWH